LFQALPAGRIAADHELATGAGMRPGGDQATIDSFA